MSKQKPIGAVNPEDIDPAHYGTRAAHDARYIDRSRAEDPRYIDRSAAVPSGMLAQAHVGAAPGEIPEQYFAGVVVPPSQQAPRPTANQPPPRPTAARSADVAAELSGGRIPARAAAALRAVRGGRLKFRGFRDQRAAADWATSLVQLAGLAWRGLRKTGGR